MIAPAVWRELRARHPKALVRQLRSFADRGGPFRLTDAELAAPTSEEAKAARALLRDPLLTVWLREETELTCPEGGEELTEEEAAGPVCPNHPEIAFSQTPVERTTFFVHDAPPTRDVPWVLALHGMNTRGAWQEELNWRVSMTYGRMVPVAIYKYGKILPGAVLRFRQRRIMAGLIERIRRLAGETSTSGFGDRPDVLAHSFGTWLLGHALTAYPKLRVGRVILLGSILRPDFDWSSLIKRGQVQAVLNHHGTADGWVRIAQRFIPCSGPSGRRGFDDPAVLNRPAKDFGHSQFFEDHVLPGLFKTVWGPFLTAAPETLRDLPGLTRPSATWRPGHWRLTTLSDRCTLAPEKSCHPRS